MASHYDRFKVEKPRERLLPLLAQRSWHHHEHPFRRAPRYEFANNETSLNGFSDTYIIADQQTYRGQI
jgi:hypothetical protein